LPDPCSEATFHASRPDAARGESAKGREWHALVQRALRARREFITPRQALLLHGTHTAQRVGATGIGAQWRYGDGQLLCLELNLGGEALAVPEQHLGPVEAREIFSHNWRDAAPGTWPAWGARWTLGAEITL
jgi:1,4-alpha-glucan branching enzyme/maltooligosyltrehalose trehalohydrolase